MTPRRHVISSGECRFNWGRNEKHLLGSFAILALNATFTTVVTALK